MSQERDASGIDDGCLSLPGLPFLAGGLGAVFFCLSMLLSMRSFAHA